MQALPNRMSGSLRMPGNGYACGTGHKEGIMTTDQGRYPVQYPVQFAVEYPDRPLNRLTSFFRIFVIIPIWIVLGTVSARPGSGREAIPAWPTGARAQADCCSSARCS